MPFNHRFPCLAEEADYLVGELQHDFPNGSPNAMTHSPKDFTVNAYNTNYTGDPTISIVTASPLTLEQRRFLFCCGFQVTSSFEEE